MKNYACKLTKNYVNNVAAFYAAVLKVKVPLIRFEEQACDKGITCRYYVEVREQKVYPGELYFNLSLTHDIRQFYFSLAHEMRHHYQAMAISDKERHLEFPEKIKIWESEMLSYKENNQPGYDDQNIELDANAFGILMMNLLFDEATPVNPKKVNIELLENAIDRIADVYDNDRLFDLAEDYNLPVSLG